MSNTKMPSMAELKLQFGRYLRDYGPVARRNLIDPSFYVQPNPPPPKKKTHLKLVVSNERPKE